MSLDWSVGDIANYKTVCWVDDGDGTVRLNRVTHQLIWACIGMGMSGITAKNAETYYRRLRLYETVFGAFLQDKDGDGYKDRMITREEVLQHIGLSTNVTQETDSEWLKRNLWGRWERETKARDMEVTSIHIPEVPTDKPLDTPSATD